MEGSNLEEQVKNILQQNSWQILASAYYTDPNTRKPREKDIIATSPQFTDEDILSYNARLFIECKYFPEATEICSKGENINKIENTILAYDIPFADISEIERHRQMHFYEYTEIFSLKDEKDFLYPAINQNLQSFDAFRKSNPERGLYYSIVIYDGQLISVDPTKNRKQCNNVLVQVDVLDSTFNLPNRKCFIEVVSVSQFENVLKKIREDINKINSSVYFYYRQKKNRIDENRRKIKEDKKDLYGL